MTDDWLAEIEARIEVNDEVFLEDAVALVAEVRRLRSLLPTVEEVESVRIATEYWQPQDGDGEAWDEFATVKRSLRDFVSRLRRAIGDPVRYIGQTQADAIIQEMIDDGTYTPSAEERPISGGGGTWPPNTVRVEYGNPSSWAVARYPEAVEAYGEFAVRVAADPDAPIRTPEEALALAEAMLADLNPKPLTPEKGSSETRPHREEEK